MIGQLHDAKKTNISLVMHRVAEVILTTVHWAVLMAYIQCCVLVVVIPIHCVLRYYGRMIVWPRSFFGVNLVYIMIGVLFNTHGTVTEVEAPF